MKQSTPPVVPNATHVDSSRFVPGARGKRGADRVPVRTALVSSKNNFFHKPKGANAARISLPCVSAGMGKMPAQFGPDRKARRVGVDTYPDRPA